MPVKTKKDEHKWQKAKEIAEERGEADNYAFIMGVYKKMHPDYQFKKADDAVMGVYKRANPKRFKKSKKSSDALLVYALARIAVEIASLDDEG